MKISYKELISRFVHGKVTNKDIIDAVDVNGCIGNRDIAIDCMELARQDEREKMQGCDVWVSWDEGNFESPTVTTKQPKTNKDSTGRIHHTDLGQNFTISKGDALKLGLQQGQCKKFRIVEVGNE